ncbi:hypothetical protein [Streptosporangium sp. KLBMP 9127]|nr:hypothetical protein [Streptosporangium sp. KLBMP 9127]
MDAESSICLSDLVPALRWSRPKQVAEVLADPRLPTGWWASVALPRAMAVMGMDWLCDRLSRLSLTRWDHLALTDVLPALQVHAADPALPGWPAPARSVVAALGGWSHVTRLTPGDLAAPGGAAPPEAVVSAVFREVLSRIPAHRSAAGAPAATTQTQTQPQTAVPHPPAPAQVPRQPQPGRAPAQPPQPAQAQPPATAPQPAVAPAASTEFPLVGLVDGMFREWQPLERAVAVERLFAADPISLRTLAHRLDVDREVLSLAQRSAEERVLHWLRSPASSALTGHLFRLTEWLGAAATQEQLIGADPAHPIEVPVLRTSLWRVLVTLMPDRRLQDGWLVVGDLGGLRERTRQLLAANQAGGDMVELLGQLGIRSHSARAWMDALLTAPPAQEAAQHERGAETASGAFAAQTPLPRRTPGANGHPRGGQPVPQVSTASIDPSAALATLSALSGNGRTHLMPGQRAGAPATPPPPPPNPASDPRRWQRIDVTSEHLRGEPVAVPEGYAAQLGMRPGTLLSVTGPGDNAVVLVWRDRQPVFDSLQPVLMRLNARPGDQVYVTVDGYRLDAQLPS